MAQPARTFRLFVSSTFEDLEAERNALHELVYPELRAFCAERNARFQPIDLRWGVSTEASLDQRAMNICLGEIRRCHEVTPRPNFLVLLGNRYGWLPPPPQIPKEEFDRIRERVPEEKRHLLDWYGLDENAEPSEYRLRPRTEPPHDDGEDYTRTDTDSPWGPVEWDLHSLLADAVGSLDLDEDRMRVYNASATEQEIREGALSRRTADDQAFCLFREITGDHPDPASANKDDPIRKYMDPDQGQLRTLKGTLDDRLPDSAIKEYEVGWDGERPGTGHLARLAQDALGLLEAAIENELRDPLPLLEVPERPPRFRDDERLDAEGKEHRKFAEERSRIFEGRETMLGTIAEYLDGDDSRPFVVHGKGGTGKSALVAEALRRAQDKPEELVYRFIGATPDSSSGRALLGSLCRELARRGYGESEASVPDGYQELVSDFRERLERAAEGPRLRLFLDSLDQLSPADGARSLSWLPNPLPAGVRVVVSTRPGDTLEPLALRQVRLEELGRLSREEGGRILDRWLQEADRDLEQPAQREAVLDGFVASESNPLWLRLAFEEARRWRSGEDPEELALDIAPEDRSTEGIIGRNTFPRLAHEENHGEVLVSRALGYLAASRYGLAEDELLDLLSRDLEVYRWFLLGTFHVPPDLLKAAATHRDLGEDLAAARRLVDRLREGAARDGPGHPDELDELLSRVLPARDGPRLPVVLWSRLLADLRPYLSERSVEGGSLITFYHRELGEVARDAYLAGEEERSCHARLADYFRRQADPGYDRSWTGESIRGLSELPYHLTQSADTDDEGDEGWQELTDTLTDFRFLERKAAEVGVVTAGGAQGEETRTHTGPYLLQDDYALALERMPGEDTVTRGRRRRIIVTGTDFGKGEGYVLRCPHCNTVHPFQDRWQGDEKFACPSCEGPLKVNDFVVPPRP